MQLLLLAVGQRLPAWADEATADFAKRFPPDLPFTLKTVKAEPRTTGKTAAQMMAAEALRLQEATPKGARRVVLDERGERLTSVQWAQRLDQWKLDGRDVVLYMGGPDGLDPALRQSADERLRLSDLTLPHALARVLLVEGLYRAWSITAGHPYHRE
ncbi:23S rRNA (pseudouridine(1915)-N(3))-methyltransferase RlmH [Inhella gelatinilytica]|uniref:Ribosomal RNA large subunit methyltransferase H n=1 Tax=Inhella gelatinilytica TaxID=2795030 RepID=A0A931J219_9BURK|nr:23S rRNA (pseudouridine(1915)-N(3))-methyltransferase RlmH [Inhella gelatinilytica]MBH9554048.1 23S rRNA (pseudouridine(1915)-N(3))-methyltransferase RlmH [Inhella gelatinilytica]